MKAEILDGLQADDPAARASRIDLRRINFLMGNERWILRRVGAMPERALQGIVEWGAGSGDLLRRLARWGPVRGVDRAERPPGLSAEAEWSRMDVLDAEAAGGILVANLFLHHFETEDLRRLGERLKGFEALVVVETWRSRTALLLGGMMLPFVSQVTRHDMLVSIRAGFRYGELAVMLGLDLGEWRILESVDPRGGLRWLAVRRDDPGGASVRRC